MNRYKVLYKAVDGLAGSYTVEIDADGYEITNNCVTFYEIEAKIRTAVYIFNNPYWICIDILGEVNAKSESSNPPNA